MEPYSKVCCLASEIKKITLESQLVNAAGIGDLMLVKYLLDLGVSVNVEEYLSCDFINPMTPLQMACEENELEAVKLLIEVGAELNATNPFGETAIHKAAGKGHLLCLRELLDAGADCNIPIKDFKRSSSTSIWYSSGMTPLHFAAADNKIECVIELIQAGADYNAIDENGHTSLYIAAKRGYGNCVLAHLKYAVGQNILLLPSLKTQDTPLHFAVQHGMIKCVEELLKLGSDPNHLAIFGISPLHYTVRRSFKLEGCSEAILKLLVLNGYNVDVNQPDNYGNIPLHYVCFSSRFHFLFERRPNLAHFLIAYGANSLIKNDLGYNIIEYELNQSDGDQRILKATIQSMLHLPPLQSLKLNPPPSPSFGDFSSAVDEHLAVEHGFGQMLDFPINPSTSRVHHSAIEEKCQWYKLIASQPRTLKHCCRYQIRASMGNRRLNRIKELHIAHRLQDYLLFKTEEF